MQITYTFSETDKAANLAAFIAAQPVPTDINGVPTMADAAWFKEWGRQAFIREIKRGKKILAEKDIDVSDNTIT